MPEKTKIKKTTNKPKDAKPVRKASRSRNPFLPFIIVLGSLAGVAVVAAVILVIVTQIAEHAKVDTQPTLDQIDTSSWTDEDWDNYWETAEPTVMEWDWVDENNSTSSLETAE